MLLCNSWWNKTGFDCVIGIGQCLVCRRTCLIDSTTDRQWYVLHRQVMLLESTHPPTHPTTPTHTHPIHLSSDAADSWHPHHIQFLSTYKDDQCLKFPYPLNSLQIFLSFSNIFLDLKKVDGGFSSHEVPLGSSGYLVSLIVSLIASDEVTLTFKIRTKTNRNSRHLACVVM